MRRHPSSDDGWKAPPGVRPATGHHQCSRCPSRQSHRRPEWFRAEEIRYLRWALLGRLERSTYLSQAEPKGFGGAALVLVGT